MCASPFRSKIPRRHQIQTRCPVCVSKSVLTSLCFTQILKKSLELFEVQDTWNLIFPAPKKPAIPKLNDYRPVAMTSVVGPEVSKRLVLSYLRKGHHMLPAGPSAVCVRSQHVSGFPGTYAGIFFVSSSSVFNAIIHEILRTKLT